MRWSTKILVYQIFFGCIILPFLVGVMGFQLWLIIGYIIVSSLFFFILLVDEKQTRLSREQDEQTCIFLSNCILNLQQGMNPINAINRASINLKGVIREDVENLSEALLVKDDFTLVLREFKETDNSFLINNFKLLMMVNFKASSGDLELMYNEFLNDIRLYQQNVMMIIKKIKGYRFGLRVISLIIVLTSMVIVDGLNVGVFNQVRNSLDYHIMLITFYIILAFVHLVVEMMMNQIIRRRV